jgi:hypothetical protein
VSARVLLLISAVLTALHTIGHSFGATHPSRETAARLVQAAMQAGSFSVGGAERTYWEMYEGYGIFGIVTGAYMTAVLLFLSAKPSRGLALVTGLAQLGIAAVSWHYFFWVPAALNAVSAGCALAAAVRA